MLFADFNQSLSQFVALDLREVWELIIQVLQQDRPDRHSLDPLHRHLSNAVNTSRGTTEMGHYFRDLLEPGMTLNNPTIRQQIDEAINLPRRDKIELSHSCMSELKLLVIARGIAHLYLNKVFLFQFILFSPINHLS
tara:strand:- start:6 stop:416 length:411 start_codon:yes stop_codon:yes gene_type:complete